MKITAYSVLLALLAFGCAGPDADNAPRFAGLDHDTPDAEHDPTDGDEDGQPDDSGSDDPGDEGNGDSEDPTDDGDPGDDEETGWDSSPPDAADGAILTAEVVCGLNEGPAMLEFEMRDGRWWLVDMDGRPNPAAEPCMDPGPESDIPYLDWNSADDLYIWAAPFDHDLVPTQVDGRWIGEVVPVREPSRECVDSLAAMGLSFPITMTLELISVED